MTNNGNGLAPSPGMMLGDLANISPQANAPDQRRVAVNQELTAGSGFLVPHHRTFLSVLNAFSRIYSYRYDEAIRRSRSDALALKRDVYIRALMQERIYPLGRWKWEIESDPDDVAEALAKNPKDPMSVERETVRRHLQAVANRTPRLKRMIRSLGWADWYGKQGCQLSFGQDQIAGELRKVVKDYRPVEGDKILYSFDGVPGIVLQMGAQDEPRLKYATIRYTDLGMPVVLLDRPEFREMVIIHTYDLDDADITEALMGGRIHGVGIRDAVAWACELRLEMMSWIMDFMEKVGNLGILIFYYEEGNPAAKTAAENSAKNASGRNALAVPVPRGGDKKTAGVDILPANMAGVQFLLSCVTDWFERHIERMIVGQSMSGGKDSGDGLGGTGRADFAKDCVPVDSEILTRDGFKSCYDVEIGDEVLSYDTETDTCRWTPLLDKTFYDDRDVSELRVGEGKQFSAICTDDHSWAMEEIDFSTNYRNGMSGETTVGTRGGIRLANPKRYLRKAQHIESGERLILAAAETEVTDSLLTPTEAAVLGWVVTDGTIRPVGKEGKVVLAICQSKETHIPEIRELVTATGATLWQGEPTTRTFPNGKTYDCKPQHWWQLPRDAGTDLLRKCGYTSKADLPRIVTRLSSASRAAMLDAMMKAEGDANRAFANKNAHVMEAFEILCALQGVATGSLRKKEYCDVKVAKKTRYVGGANLELHDAGKADIWCPTTKYGTWVMRQRGRVMITGNTKYVLLASDAEDMGETLTTDFIKPLKEANFSDAPWRYTWQFRVPDPNSDKILDAIGKAANMPGKKLTFKADEVRQLVGLTKPDDGDDIVGGEEIIPMDPNRPQPMPGQPGQGQANPAGAGSAGGGAAPAGTQSDPSGGAGDGRKESPPADVPGMAELVAAMFQAAESEDWDAVDRLAELGSDPSALAGLMDDDEPASDVVAYQRSHILPYQWSQGTTRNGHIKAVWSGDGAKKPLYGKAAERALANQGKRDRGEEVVNPAVKAKEEAAKREPGRQEARETWKGAAENPGGVRPEQLPELADQLKRLTRDEIRNINRELGNKLGGLKADLVQRLLDHVGAKEEEPAPEAKKTEKTKPKRPTKASTGESLAAVVQSYGGIDPNDSELKAHFSNMKEALEYGFTIGMFKKGGAGLDQMANTLEAAGHITTPEGKFNTQHLVDQLAKKARSDLFDTTKEVESALDSYYRELSEVTGGTNEYTPGELGPDWDNPTTDRPEVAEAVRSGKEAGEREAQRELSADGGGSTAFDFGHNAEPVSEPAPVPNKAGRKAVVQDFRRQWSEARQSLGGKVELPPEKREAEKRLLEALEVLTTGKEREGPHDLGPVSPSRYEGYKKLAAKLLGELTA